MAIVPESFELRENLKRTVHKLFDAVDSLRRDLHDDPTVLDRGHWYRFSDEIDRLSDEFKRNRQALQEYYSDGLEDEDDCED